MYIFEQICIRIPIIVCGQKSDDGNMKHEAIYK